MTSNTSTAIDLSLLPPPNVVRNIEFETILSEGLTEFYQRIREVYPEYQDLLESDPVMKLAEAFAYREMLIRQDSNKQALSVLLAYAEKEDLDHKASERNIKRRVISEATATTDAVMESDESLRRRVQLAPESQTTAGSEGSYIFHGLNADIRIKDIYPDAPLDENGMPNATCNIYVLSTEGDGSASEELLNIVSNALNSKNVRPLTDRPMIYSASVLNYRIEAEIIIEEGPDESVILDGSYEAAKEYTNSVHSFNDGVSLSGIYQALHQPGVLRVNLISPISNIDTSLGQVAYCQNIQIKRVTA